MKKIILRFSAITMLACLLFACQKQLTNDETSRISSASDDSQQSSTAFGCGLLRTQTPGGWGAEPNGNNPGAYLHANFDQAFGELTVGCYPGDFYVKLTSAQAITNLLPTGGQTAILTTSFTDPASMKNTLVGHLVSLKLSVGFDGYDANFGQSSVSLSDMIIGSGPFQGSTVSEFLDEAEQVLGGCSSSHTVQQALQTATAINENFDNGTVNKGYLICPRENSGGGGGLDL